MLGLGQWIEQYNLTMLVFRVVPYSIRLEFVLASLFFLSLSRTFACHTYLAFINSDMHTGSVSC